MQIDRPCTDTSNPFHKINEKKNALKSTKVTFKKVSQTLFV